MSSAHSRSAQIARLTKQMQLHHRHIDMWAQKGLRVVGAPIALPGEAFSSWAYRVRRELSWPMGELRSRLNLSRHMFWLDFALSRSFLDRLKQEFLLPASSFDHLLPPVNTLLSQQAFSCLTCAPLSKRPLYRYCPTCFKEDAIPFVRRSWRFSFSYVCERHKVLLRDACPACKFRFFSSLKTSSSLRYCQNCGVDLSQSEGRRLPDELMQKVLARQNELHELVLGQQPALSGAGGLGAGMARQMLPGPIGVLDVGTTGGALHLLSYLKLSATHSHAEIFSSMEMQVRRELLGHYLLELPCGSASGGHQTVAIGLDGNRLFGHVASAIAAHLIGQQDLWGGTYWWSPETQVPWVRKHKPELFRPTDAAEWVASLTADSQVFADAEESAP